MLMGGTISAATTTAINLADKGMNLSDHMKLRMKQRNLKMKDIVDAYENPLKVGEIVYDEMNRPSVRYTGAKATIVVNPETGTVITGYPTSTRIVNKLNANKPKY